MKRAMISVVILAVLGFWIPCARAGISQDLDPMVSPEPQTTVTGETSNVVSTADATAAEKKMEEAKKEESKKSSMKKSSSKKKSGKSGKERSSKSPKKTKKSSW